MLESDQVLAGIDSTVSALKTNADGSVAVWVAPKRPAGTNRTGGPSPGENWNTFPWSCAPLQPWFDRIWNPEVRAFDAALGCASP